MAVAGRPPRSLGSVPGRPVSPYQVVHLIFAGDEWPGSDWATGRRGRGEAVTVAERLLERAAVLAQLGRCQRSAGRGQGRVVLLRGEAGVGKTMVIARFVAGLPQRARAVRGWCDAFATPRPLGPLIDMLADLPGEQAARRAGGHRRG